MSRVRWSLVADKEDREDETADERNRSHDSKDSENSVVKSIVDDGELDGVDHNTDR